MTETSSQIVTSLAFDMTLGTAYVDKNVKKISKRSTLKPTGLCPVAIDKSVVNSPYMIDILDSKQKPLEEKCVGN